MRRLNHNGDAGSQFEELPRKFSPRQRQPTAQPTRPKPISSFIVTGGRHEQLDAHNSHTRNRTAVDYSPRYLRRQPEAGTGIRRRILRVGRDIHPFVRCGSPDHQPHHHCRRPGRRPDDRRHRRHGSRRPGSRRAGCGGHPHRRGAHRTALRGHPRRRILPLPRSRPRVVRRHLRASRLSSAPG